MQVKYKNVMKEYGLGPNGAILTSLNLFATRFGEVCYTTANAHTCIHKYTQYQLD